VSGKFNNDFFNRPSDCARRCLQLVGAWKLMCYSEKPSTAPLRSRPTTPISPIPVVTSEPAAQSRFEATPAVHVNRQFKMRMNVGVKRLQVRKQAVGPCPWRRASCLLFAQVKGVECQRQGHFTYSTAATLKRESYSSSRTATFGSLGQRHDDRWKIFDAADVDALMFFARVRCRAESVNFCSIE